MSYVGMERTYRLRTNDYDRYGRLKPEAVLDVFQDIAAMQASTIGIGMEDVNAKGAMWAVVRMSYEVVRNPGEHAEVVARTWPHTLSRFSFLRDYSMRDMEGNLLIRSTSEWVMMDLETRGFVSVRDYYDGPTNFDPLRMYERKPRKLHDFDASGLEPYTVVPRYSDVDENGHVNNSHYAAFVLDAIDPTSAGSIRSFQIDFRHEALEGQPLRVFTKEDEGAIDAKGLNENDEIAFAARIGLQ